MGVTAAVAAVAGVANSVYQGEQQKKFQKKARIQAETNAKKQENMAEQQLNASNRKRPDTMAMLDAASQSARAGNSGTMLTGPQGVDPGLLTLGRNTLLGGGG